MGDGPGFRDGVFGMFGQPRMTGRTAHLAMLAHGSKLLDLAVTVETNVGLDLLLAACLLARRRMYL